MPAPGLRKAAAVAGRLTYFTGLACPRGHVAERYTGSGTCVGCRIERQAAHGFREKHRAASKKSYLKNRDKIGERQKEYRSQNPALVKARKDSWRKRNPEKARAYVLNRRSKVGAGGSLSAGEIKAIVARQRGRCAACGEKAKLEMDHIMPLALGGGGDAGNFQGLCKPCNIRKHAKHPIDFNRSLGLLL